MSERKLTLKQENFCLAYVETGNASEAYRRAYNTERMKDNTINREAKAMMDDPKIATRLAELREPIMAEHKITVDSLVEELDVARAVALSAKNPQVSAAVAATLGKAKMLGLLVDKQEISGKDGAPFAAAIVLVKPDGTRTLT